MLALRSREKEDLECTFSEIVYGTQLCLPGEFFESFHTKKGVTPLFIAAQQKFISNFKYQESRFPDTSKSYVDPQLNHCRHVFIRNDAVRSPLHPTCDGPFKVLNRIPKYFKAVVPNPRSADRYRSVGQLVPVRTRNC